MGHALAQATVTRVEAAFPVFLLVGEEVVDIRRRTEFIIAVVVVGYRNDVAEIFQMTVLVALLRIDTINCVECAVNA